MSLTPVSPAIANQWYEHRFPRENNVAVYAAHASNPGDGFYEHAQSVGRAIASADMGVVTGGGPGGMRAVAEGAGSVGGHAAGMCMDFPGETPSLDVHPEAYHFDNFSDRIDKGFNRRAAFHAAVPGGIGTLHEVFKAVDENQPVVMFDKDHVFANLKQYIQDNMVRRGFVRQSQLDQMIVVDEDHIQDGVDILKQEKNLQAPRKEWVA